MDIYTWHLDNVKTSKKNLKNLVKKWIIKYLVPQINVSTQYVWHIQRKEVK